MESPLLLFLPILAFTKNLVGNFNGSLLPGFDPLWFEGFNVYEKVESSFRMSGPFYKDELYPPLARVDTLLGDPIAWSL